MQNSSSLLKDILHNSIAEGLYNEITSRTARYYYFLGKTLSWEDELTPPLPVDSFNYELQTRNEIITMKEIKPTDVAFVVPRYSWQPNVVYDMYDDQYSKEVQGIDLISGGQGYGSAPTVYIGTAGSVTWTPSTVVFEGNFLKTSNGNGGFRYYVVVSGGTTGTTAPVHTEATVANGSAQLTFVNASDGGGFGAAAQASVLDGRVIDIELTSRGDGYVAAPSVILVGGSGSGAYGEANVVIAPSGAQRLEDSRFYVITDEFNVYKCLDNNNNAISHYKPIGTTVDPVTFPDGYMWKFLYNIPIALRTKFLTDDYVPVVTALRNQFYSNGNIQTIRVDQAGSGYTSATISVQGDGYLEADPLYLTSINIDQGGVDYTTATISVAAPFTNVNPWTANIPLFLGQKISQRNNIYEVAVAGTSGTVAPVHRYGTVANGTVALKYIGTTATGEVTVTDGEIASVTLFGMVRDVSLTTGGSGYTSAPTVNFTSGSGIGAIAVSAGGAGYTNAPTITFTGGGGTGAAATAVVSGGAITVINVTSAGTGYTTTPTIVITPAVGDTITTPAAATATLTGATAVAVLQSGSVSKVIITDGGSGYTSAPTVAFGTAWTSSTAVTFGQQLYVSNRLYTVTVAGTTSTTAPTHLSGTASNGTATLAYAGQPATGTVAIKYGAGYSELPIVTFVGDGTGASAYFSGVKSEAKLVPTISGGQLVGVQIDDGGVGYTYATLSVNGNGTGAEISADLSPGDVNTLQANIELLTLDGRIMSIPVISGGWGYAAASVTIEGDGVGAAATAVIGARGEIKKIVITNYGQNYRWARVTISGNGFGAKARAIITPYGGHGKFALNGLYAKTLMFYTNISGDKNQGFDVNNDYRQLGIIKNPSQFGNTNNLTAIAASACWVVSGVISTTFFPADSLVSETSSGRRFRVVTNTGSAALLQSLDNFIPQIGTTFTNAGNFTFTANAVTPPTADKYSGDLLFIDNKAAFTPTADQSVTLRTVIRF
jgi:hypothetical protein